MKWDTVKKGISQFAPLLGMALGGPAGGAIGKLVGNVLGTDDNPDNIAAALEGVDDQTKARLIELQENNKYELEKLAILKETQEIKSGSQDVENVNKSMQAEAAQGHQWSGAWRPVWGFVSAAAFGVSVIGIFILIGIAIATKNTAMLKDIPGIIQQLVFLFGIPGAILGVASWHRGVKQRIESGQQDKPSLMGALISRVSKG